MSTVREGVPAARAPHAPPATRIRALVFTSEFGLGAGSTYGPFSETLLHMARLGHEFHVVCSSHLLHSVQRDFAFEGGGRLVVHPVPSGRPLARLLTVPRRFLLGAQLLRRHRLNLVYAHIIIAWGIIGALLARIAGRPFAFWICSDWPKEARTGNTLGQRLLLGPGFGFVIRSAARVVTCTEFARAAAAGEAAVDETRFTIVPNAVDVERFQPSRERRAAMRARLGLRDEPVVVYLSQLSPRKGALDLVGALPTLFAEVPDARCVFIGDGPDRKEAERRVHEGGIAGRVIFAGRVATADAPDWLAAADVFCVPSVYEGFGRVFAEAMAAGLPVVSTTAGGIPEVVPDNEAGLLVPRRDPVALAHALVTLLRDEAARQRMGTAGRQRARALYHQEVVARQYATALQTALDGMSCN